jgi:hypothetical protein
MRFRIGINLRDIFEEGKRIYGGRVNIADRLEFLLDGYSTQDSIDHTGELSGTSMRNFWIL